jgi:hypothetical protein
LNAFATRAFCARSIEGDLLPKHREFFLQAMKKIIRSDVFQQLTRIAGLVRYLAVDFNPRR